MKRLSIVVSAVLAAAACTPQEQVASHSIPRPAPGDPKPAGIAYLCDGRKEVTVVYAKNRASVTFDGRTWRMEYQAAGDGFRYIDAGSEWTGRDEQASLRDGGRPLAFNCRPVRRTT